MQHRTRARHSLTSRPTARTLLAARVRRALGFPGTHTIQHGDTATHVTVWDIHSLQTVYNRVGGQLTLAPVTRTLSDGTTYNIVETTLTTRLPGVATACVTTDWDPATEVHGYALPVIRDYTTAGARRG
ncbi:hypothetical protein ACIPQA_16360 [Streptomyces sp. NPDC090109]|uniref:hypothetical protein n=1 Tax=Streptomyces sp. NPDC090109 TaxID=3365948 RepID=UPI0037F6D825